MAIDYSVLAQPKGRTRKQLKARRTRQAAKVVTNVRATCLARADNRCECCGLPFFSWELQAHHRRPRSLGGAWSISNIRMYCARCHARAHRLRVA